MSSKGVDEQCLGWAARDASGVLSPYKFSRRYPPLVYPFIERTAGVYVFCKWSFFFSIATLF